MAAEWLRADQVAAIGARHQRYPVPPNVAPSPLCDDDGQEWPCDAARLLAQDARWRALVGELLPGLRHARTCVPSRAAPCTCGVDALKAQAQAALDGAE